MCLACLIVDHMLTFDPPFGLDPVHGWQPPVPLPHTPWPLERLRAYYDLLQEAHRVGEQGRPCSRAHWYLERFGARLAALEQKAEESR